jgi:hypothetical protein
MTPPDIRFGLSGYAALAVLATAGAALLALDRPGLFRPYFGGLSPPIAVAAVALAGAAALQMLRRHGFEIVSKDAATGALAAALLATVFAAAVVIADIVLGYPRGMNVAAPSALLFYPVIALVAEIAFHVAPLALLCAIARLVAAGPISTRVLWAGMIVVALVEPAFQLFAAASDGALSPADLYTGPHVLAFGIAALWIFRRYGFSSMLVLRLVYYAYWHVAWGYARPSLLF